MSWWVWLIIGFSLIFIEMFTPVGLALLIIGLSFVITGIASAIGLNDPPWIEWLICFITSVVLFVTVRKPLMRFFGLDSPSNYKEFEGREILITSEIEPQGIGQGEMQGSSWKVRNTGTQKILPGERLKIKIISGLTVEVEKNKPLGGI